MKNVRASETLAQIDRPREEIMHSGYKKCGREPYEPEALPPRAEFAGDLQFARGLCPRRYESA